MNNLHEKTYPYISIIILAAGLSKRMGAFKPLLPVGGEPAILRCINTASEAGVRDIVVVTGRDPGAIESTVGNTNMNVRLVHNNMFRKGMLSSVQAGVSAIRGDSRAFFILPSDCCASTCETFIMLLQNFDEDRGASVIRPSFNGKRGHPPLIPARYAKSLNEYDGNDGLKGFLRPLPTLEVEMTDQGALLDMDTPEDYAQMLEYLGLPVYPDKERCAELMKEYCVPEDIVSHGEQVAELALSIARQLEDCGIFLNTGLLESACLLHDIMRAKTHHAREGMELLLQAGYPGAAILVGSHMDLSDGVCGDIGEKELLFLADKLCRKGRIVDLEDTEQGISRMYAPDSEAYVNAMSRMAAAREIREILRDKYKVETH